MRRRGTSFATIKRRGTRRFAGGRWRRWKVSAAWGSRRKSMAVLGEQIQRFLEQLARENASEHTLRNYASDLAQFLEYFTPPGADAPAPGQLDKLAFREWMGSLHERQLSAVTIRRKLAAVRSLFNFLHRTGVVPVNVAKRLRT